MKGICIPINWIAASKSIVKFSVLFSAFCTAWKTCKSHKLTPKRADSEFLLC